MTSPKNLVAVYGHRYNCAATASEPEATLLRDELRKDLRGAVAYLRGRGTTADAKAFAIAALLRHGGTARTFDPRTGEAVVRANVVVVACRRFGRSPPGITTMGDGIYAEWSAQDGSGPAWTESVWLCGLPGDEMEDRRAVQKRGPS